MNRAERCWNTQVLDFFAQHGITADIELNKPDQPNEAFERLEKKMRNIAL